MPAAKKPIKDQGERPGPGERPEIDERTAFGEISPESPAAEELVNLQPPVSSAPIDQVPFHQFVCLFLDS